MKTYPTSMEQYVAGIEAYKAGAKLSTMTTPSMIAGWWAGSRK